MEHVKLSNPTSGSTIVGVLAAIVFISIVAAFMVKNTGSQSAASVGYSSAQVMGSTASSAVVATEGFIFYEADSAIALINRHLKAEAGTGPAADRMPFIFGKSAHERKKLAENQYFSSRLVACDKNTQYSQFEMESAKRAGGKGLRRARAFYYLGNLVPGSDNKYGGKNAIYMKGGLTNGDNGMEVFGGATFEGKVKLQNSPGIFHGEAYFQEDVSVMHGGTVFHDKAYFGGNANFQNFAGTHNVFESDVGFNKNYATQGSQSVRAAGDVYIKGDFRVADEWSDNFDGNAYITSAVADKTLYYTDNLSLQGTNCVMVNGSCSIHGNNHISPANIKNFTQQVNMDDMDVLDRLNMSSIEYRRDPQIDVSKIPGNIIKPAFGTMSDNGGNLDVGKLESAYFTAKENGELYQDHLVIKVGRGDPGLNFNASDPGTFNQKVIIIIEDGATLNTGGRFYHSGPESSTLIYAGAGNAALQQFGSSGLFRGLIYIDEDNIAQNSFNWKNGGSIEGAFHNFSNRDFEWNSGASSAVKIKFDENVINAFGTLVKGGSGGAGDLLELVDGEDVLGIGIVRAGYYYD